MTRVRFAVLILLAAACAAAQEPDQAARRQSFATRTDTEIRIDGRLDEAAWATAQPLTDFVQKEPVEGAAPTDAMDVRFLYDGGALYVGARMSTRNAPDLQAPLGRRDSTGQTEHLLVSLDTFLDRRTAYDFGVTAAGVRLDRYHSSDNEDSYDSGFDPVWQAAVSRSEDGWTAELWIPFSQLRFTPMEDQVWGLNIRRFRPTLDEEDYWVLIPRTEPYWSSRFGDLRGISGLRATHRIEALPYVAGASTLNAGRDARNPFDDGRNLEGRVGADFKMGLGPNLTLDATVNPDFGQVEADPAEVNLTAFETRFQEKRPFFLEGSQLFNIGHPNFYYSRRIGARPIGPATGDFVDYPQSTTILAAAKLSGRLPSKTSIAALGAVTDGESAQLASLGTPGVRSTPVTPRAYWGVGRVLQEFGPLGSTAGLLVVAVHRDVTAGDPLADLLSRNAVALAGDTRLRFKGGEYQFRAAGGGSFVNGQPKAIERLQRSSSHYAQRPDKDYARLDPAATSYDGLSFQTNFDRVGGRHWLWGVSTKVDSPDFETNDIATLTGADGIMPTWNVRYRETRPGRVFRTYSFQLSNTNEWNWGGDRQTNQWRQNVNVTWANFWTSSVSVSENLPVQSQTLTRGGPLMTTLGAWSMGVSLGNRSTSETRWSGSYNVGGGDGGAWHHRISTDFSFRPGPRWQFSVSPFYERLVDPQQYATALTGGRDATYGKRYVFANIERSTFSSEYRLSFTLKPDMNLDVYAEPFAASGRYYEYGELRQPGVSDRLTYGTAPGTTLQILDDGSRLVSEGGTSFTLSNRDFNVRSFRSNVVLRWEWRPGSTLYVVWQQDRSADDPFGTRVGIDDMFRSITAPGSNYFIIKTSFWLPLG